MKFMIAFFMAWGNFITLPCPYKRWDPKLKNMMLAFLPLVGLVIGAVWVLVLWILRIVPEIAGGAFGMPDLLAAAVGSFTLFVLCGFMHLDGFMDCNDAILSRRPLEDRQRILKDSNVGAFAVVTVIFLLMAWFGCMSVCWNQAPMMELLLIPVVSRFAAGWAVQSFKPIGHSQYREDFNQEGKGKWKVMSILLFLVILVCAHIPYLLMGAAELVDIIGTTLAVVLAVMVAASGEGAYARKQLGGMSGDIAGYMICYGELAGIIVLTILTAA